MTPRVGAGERRKPYMPTYVSLVSWTDQGIRNVSDTVERLDRGAEVAQKYRVRLQQTYWTIGSYDMVSIAEAPDDEAVTAYLLEVCSAGNIRTTTLRAFDREEMGGIIERLGLS
jgi:uncharacterized protein with GYD domain